MKSLNLPEGFTSEKISTNNVGKYMDLHRSISYISRFSGYGDFREEDVIKDIAAPVLPENWKVENNHVEGICDGDGNPLCWIKYYGNFLDEPFIFLGEFFVHRGFQGSGYGRHILTAYEDFWKSRGYKKIFLNVDLKNLAALRFWINNGYKNIDKIFGDREIGENFFAMLRLSKELENTYD